MSERLNEFEEFSSEFENDGLSFGGIETQPTEPSLFERTPIEKLLDAEVMVEISNFPYPSNDTPIKYAFGDTQIELKSNMTDGRRTSVSLALQTSGSEPYQLYSLVYAHIENTDRVDYLNRRLVTHESTIANLKKAQEEDKQKYKYDGYWPTLDAIRAANESFYKMQIESEYSRFEMSLELVDQMFPWERSDVTKLGISKPTADNKTIVYFHTEDMPADDYLRLPVKALPLELLSDKGILSLVLENIENTRESKEMWNLFLKNNQKNLPLNAYLQISTKIQTMITNN